jgi:hypothetical protein
MTHPTPLPIPPSGPAVGDETPIPWPPARRRLLIATRTTASAWLARRCVRCGAALEQHFYVTCTRCRP